jgi:mono/diheme cytochrome c family protein
VRHLPIRILAVAALLANIAFVCAQGRGGRGAINDVTDSRSFDKAQVERGKTTFGMLCGSCHGADARGGAGKAGIDLIRSVMVLDDVGGKALGEFLKTGRPAKNMPAFTLSDEQVSDIAAFLHAGIAQVSERGAYKYLDVLVGNAKAGEAYFNGAGGCTKCHSVTSDLKGIGAKYDPPALQLRIVTGGGGPGRGGNDPRTAKQVTITFPDGKVVSGILGQISPFTVSVRDASGPPQTFPRDGDNPKVEIVDPLQAHLDLMRKYTDDDMHNLTAYLATLK